MQTPAPAACLPDMSEVVEDIFIVYRNSCDYGIGGIF